MAWKYHLGNELFHYAVQVNFRLKLALDLGFCLSGMMLHLVYWARSLVRIFQCSLLAVRLARDLSRVSGSEVDS